MRPLRCYFLEERENNVADEAQTTLRIAMMHVRDIEQATPELEHGIEEDHDDCDHDDETFKL